MTLSLEDAFLAEQLVLVAFALTALALFCAQAQAATGNSDGRAGRRANVKHRLHRVGILAALLQLAVSLDPFSLRGIFEPVAVSWIGANLTALFVTALVLLNQTAVEVVYLARLRAVPTMNAVAAGLMVLTLFVGANTSYGLVYKTGKWWYSSIDLLVSSAVLLGVVICFDIVATHITAALERSKSQGRSRNSAKRRQMIARATVITLIGLAVLPLQILAAVERLRDREAPVAEPDQDDFRMRDRAFIYGHVAATVILLWYSWIPAPDKSGYEPVSTFRPRNASGSSSGVSRYSVEEESDSRNSASWKSATHRRLRGASQRSVSRGVEDIDIEDATNLE